MTVKFGILLLLFSSLTAFAQGPARLPPGWARVRAAEIECTKTWTGGGLDQQMATAKNWNPQGVPGQTDTACILDSESDVLLSSVLSIGSLVSEANVDVLSGGELIAGGSAYFDGDLTLYGNLVLNGDAGSTVAGTMYLGGILTGPDTLTIEGLLTWHNGYMCTFLGTSGCAAPVGDQGITEAKGGIDVDTGVLWGRTLNNYEIATFSGTSSNFIGVADGAEINNEKDATWGLVGDVYFGIYHGTTTFNNDGTLEKKSGTGTSSIYLTNISNTGTVTVDTGTLSFPTGYTQSSSDSNTFLNGGSLSVGTGLEMEDGTLTGSGAITGPVDNVGGTVAPGTSKPTYGTIRMPGYTYTQGEDGALKIKVGGTGGGQYDVLVVGDAVLDGDLNVSVTGGFSPGPSDYLTIVATSISNTYGFLSGTFATTSLGALPPGWHPIYSHVAAVISPAPTITKVLATDGQTGYTGMTLAKAMTVQLTPPLFDVPLTFTITDVPDGAQNTALFAPFESTPSIEASTDPTGSSQVLLQAGSKPGAYEISVSCDECGNILAPFSETAVNLIDSVEMTQAIQQLQPLADLETSLASDGPPVPIIAGKPGVMRVYLTALKTLSKFNVNLMLQDSSQTEFGLQTLLAYLIPQCTTTLQRAQANGCQSIDFYFTPPTGSWTGTLTVTSPQTGTVLETEVLNFTSLSTEALIVRAVSVCDSSAFNGVLPLCGLSLQMLGDTALLAKISPTDNVALDITPEFVTLPASPYCPDPNNSQTCDFNGWWSAVVAQLGEKYASESAATDMLNNQRTVYFGMVRSGIPGNTTISGRANGIPSNAAASVTSEFDGSIQIVQGAVAHETGHTLGLLHTNTENPRTTAPPGCYGFAADPTTDWPWQNPQATVQQNGATTTVTGDTGTNLIRSGTVTQFQSEVPFDVALHTALPSGSTYEIMSYCWPQWIAPQRYNTMVQTLSPPAAPSSPAAPKPSARPTPPRTVATKPFWTVSGTIPSIGPVQFGPLFQSVLQSDTSGGSGTDSLVVEDSSGTALFTQHFTPQTPTDTPVGTTAAVPNFAQLVPVTAGAASIVLKDHTGAILGSIPLGGAAPTVTITNPTAAFTGAGAITWTISDPDSLTFTSRVYYSANNGSTWSEIGQVPNSGTSMMVDFTKLPGTNGMGLIRVLVSDGVNTGQATSPNFSVPKSAPSLVQITSPTPNFAQPAASPVYLSGMAYDTDDGLLSGAALVWSSNLQGSLGTGSPLSVKLQPGVHTITLTATDSDNNSIHTAITITIGGQPPTLGVTLTTLAAPAASIGCVEAAIAAAPGINGAPLSSVQYSLDGGGTYAAVPLNQLPYTFLVPGSGTVGLLARVIDSSNQTAAQSASASLTSACVSLAVPSVVGLTQAAAATALSGAGLVVGLITNAANNSIPVGSVIRQIPAQGTAIPSGSSVAVNLVISTGPSASAACDVNSDGTPDVSDVQTMINQAMGTAAAANDLNHDGHLNVVDAQIVINAALGQGCSGS